MWQLTPTCRTCCYSVSHKQDKEEVNGRYSKQKMVLGTHTSEGEQNYLMLAEVSLFACAVDMAAAACVSTISAGQATTGWKDSFCERLAFWMLHRCTCRSQTQRQMSAGMTRRATR